MIEKILKEINRLKGELDGYSASEALDYIEAYINTLPEEPTSEDLDKLVISLEETIGTSPHSREVIKEHLQRAAEWQKQLIQVLEYARSLDAYNQFGKERINKDIAWFEKQGNIDKASYDLAEKEKREFVGDGFIKCYADFQDFKEGETYWLEYLGNDNYNVRSDNLLGKTYHITPCQLYTIFKKQTWLEKQGNIDKALNLKKQCLTAKLA